MKKYSDLLRGIAQFARIGWTVVFPPLALTALALRLGLGAVGCLVAVLAGLVASACGVWRIFRSEARRAEREEKRASASFDRHD